MENRYAVYTEWLSPKRIAAELAMDYGRVLSWINRKVDPLPARLIDGNKKQVRVNRSELNEWLYRNSEAA